ncbi:hypothetical protein LEMLEM_LOCUS19843 [Lemmus lemmus]
MGQQTITGVKTITYLGGEPAVLTQREEKVSIHYGWVSPQREKVSIHNGWESPQREKLSIHNGWESPQREKVSIHYGWESVKEAEVKIKPHKDGKHTENLDTECCYALFELFEC